MRNQTVFSLDRLSAVYFIVKECPKSLLCSRSNGHPLYSKICSRGLFYICQCLVIFNSIFPLATSSNLLVLRCLLLHFTFPKVLLIVRGNTSGALPLHCISSAMLRTVLVETSSMEFNFSRLKQGHWR